MVIGTQHQPTLASKDSINSLFKLKYSQNFHCVHFVIEAGRILFGRDYSRCFVGLTGQLNDAIKADRKGHTINHKIDAPIEGCIVLMRYHSGNSHVGLFYEGRLFHLTENGVSRPTLDQIEPMFARIRFYEPNFNN